MDFNTRERMCKKKMFSEIVQKLYPGAKFAAESIKIGFKVIRANLSAKKSLN